ncbi:MAG: dephospho-CoA kinase [Spirochaetaceae bacterium]|nr:dephospho-CoA kinase [Spirochaetaceae bacterium]
MVIGIAGKTAAGKNMAANTLEKQGYLIIDADKLGIEALTANKNAIVAAFGTAILDSSGEVSRPKLGQLVFSGKEQLVKLNAISHPYIVEQIKKIIEQNKEREIAINAALLPYWPLKGYVNVVIWLTAPLPVRVIRALKRDKRGLLFTLKRIYSQRSLSLKYLSYKVDIYRVRNYCGQRYLNKQMVKILSKIKQGGYAK